MTAVYDKKRIPILPGDTIKVFHYISAVRREKRFMYKFVEGIEYLGKERNPWLKIAHLNLTKDTYYMKMDESINETIEIVQGYKGVCGGEDYRDRKKKNVQAITEILCERA